MRTVAALAFTALVVVGGGASCNTTLNVERRFPPDAGDDGAFPGADAETLPDGAPKPDGAGPNTCARGDCSPGGCVAEKCLPFEVTKHAGEELVGVAATNDRVFYTSKTAGTIRVWQSGATSNVVKFGEASIGAIEVIGTQIFWAKPTGGGEQGGVYKADLSGTAKTRANFFEVTNCRAFAFYPTNLFFLSNGTGVIKKDNNTALSDWASSSSTVGFLASSPETGNIVWTNQTGIHRGPPNDTTIAGDGTLVLDGISPVGVAVDEMVVYFTEANGRVGRVALTGGAPETLYMPSPPLTGGMADITVTPDARRVYWAQADTVMGLVLPLP